MVGNEDTEAMLPVCLCIQSHMEDDKCKNREEKRRGKIKKTAVKINKSFLRTSKDRIRTCASDISPDAPKEGGHPGQASWGFGLGSMQTELLQPRDAE